MLGYIDLRDEYPHRARLLRLLESNVAEARKLAEQVDPDSARHVRLYVSALLVSIETVKTCGSYGHGVHSEQVCQGLERGD